ncbi:MAG: hydroxyacid dehydrogenase [Proteobacteria bacterium]|nr:hydroxyacid dehydrogenase [Pseudomonadota bacterium]
MADILVTEYLDPAVLDRLKADYSIDYDKDLWLKPDEMAARVRGVAAMIVRNQTQVRGALLQAANRLRCVGRLGVGLDNIDLDDCANRSIKVFPATGANSDSVAELAIGGIFVMFRKAYHEHAAVIAGEWPRMRMMGNEIMNRRLAIVGFGSIGKALAWRAKGIGLKVNAFDPYVPASDPRWAEYGVEKSESLIAAVKDADIVSIHTPLNDETRNMFDATVISAMRPGALLFNLARGGIVNEPDLISALKAGTIAGAFLDVLDKEPLPAGNAFAGVPNLLLTPHVGARTREADDRVCNMIADAVLAELKREPAA